jgi:hypothetical protein
MKDILEIRRRFQGSRLAAAAPRAGIRLLVAMALCLAALDLSAESAKRAVLIRTTPPGAIIELNFVPKDSNISRAKNWPGGTGSGGSFTVGAFKYVPGDELVVKVSCQNYAAKTLSIDYAYLSTNVDSDKVTVTVEVTLDEIRREIPVNVAAGEGARVSVDGRQSDPPITLVFTRASGTSEWSPVTIRVVRKNYVPFEQAYKLAEVEAAPLVGGRHQLTVSMTESHRELPLTVTANEIGANIVLDDKPAGATPTNVVLNFNRPDAKTAWSTNLLRVEKDGVEWRPPGTNVVSPFFETNLTLEAAQALAGRLDLTSFQPVLSFIVPMRRFAVARGEVTLELTNSISATKGPEETVPLSVFTRAIEDTPLIVGRMGAFVETNMAGRPGVVVIALPMRESRAGSPAEIVGSSIFKLTSAGARTPMTDQVRGTYDLDPCVTKDGKTLYFSSNRGGQWGIWKKASYSAGARTPVDQGHGVDVEPAVFTPSEGLPRVAFTRYPRSAASDAAPTIIIQSEDGASFPETLRGRSPAWSNDGTKIAYVSPEGKICLMAATGYDIGSSLAQFASDKTVDDSPLWLPGDRKLIFARAASPEEARNGTGNYNLWTINDDGTDPVQLILNPSFDGVPILTWDGTKQYIYFFSNRGAQRKGEESWRIYYFEHTSR